jgi:hypothetical protein
MQNTTLKQTQTSFFPHAVEYIRLVRRQTQNGMTYTVATQNNCIQKNHDLYVDANKHYLELVLAHKKTLGI